MTSPYDPDAAQAVSDLLAFGDQEGFGLTFEPTEGGWSVGWVRQSQGGFLAKGSDIAGAATAALGPLVDLVEQRRS